MIKNNILKGIPAFYTTYLVALLYSFQLNSQQSTIHKNYELVYHQSFDQPDSVDDFEMSDPFAWRFSVSANGHMELFESSNYEARVRSPFNIALLKGIQVGDFVMEVKLSQTGREYGHRDLCLFFGAKDPTNFYYVHLASVADDHANNIFLVNDEPRIKIGSKSSDGTDWGTTESWHTVRIERKLEEGLIRVYFDNLDEPIMESIDHHFDYGRIGFGSFDDTGRFDDLKIWAPEKYKITRGFFSGVSKK